MRDDFCAFILTHGRPDKVFTWGLLERAGYTGKVYLVIDDEDEKGDEYRETFGEDRVLVFSKDEVSRYTNQWDTFRDRRAILWARNVCWGLARKLGVKYFIQLDDDYSAFQHRRSGHRDGVLGYHSWKVSNLDKIFEAMVKFMETTPARTIAVSQGGDHFGGSDKITNFRLRRKAMNTFVCDVDRYVGFEGRINEDVNAYVGKGRKGELFFTYMAVQVTQGQTQNTDGGMTGLYLDAGTYVKSFYSVMGAPSCVDIRMVGTAFPRLHHKINWRLTTPKILDEKHRKGPLA